MSDLVGNHIVGFFHEAAHLIDVSIKILAPETKHNSSEFDIINSTFELLLSRPNLSQPESELRTRI